MAAGPGSGCQPRAEAQAESARTEAAVEMAAVVAAGIITNRRPALVHAAL